MSPPFRVSSLDAALNHWKNELKDGQVVVMDTEGEGMAYPRPKTSIDWQEFLECCAELVRMDHVPYHFLEEVCPGVGKAAAKKNIFFFCDDEDEDTETEENKPPYNALCPRVRGCILAFTEDLF